MIEIPVSLSASKAAEVVKLAAIRREVSILSNEGGVMQIEPIHPKPKNPTEVRLRVNIISTSDTTSIIAVSGRWYSPLTAEMQRIVVGPNYGMQKDVGEPVEVATKGWKAILWNVVKDFAESVKEAASVAQ